MQEMQKFTRPLRRLQERMSDLGQDAPNGAADRRNFRSSLVSLLGAAPLRVAVDRLPSGVGRAAASCTGSFSAGWVMPAF
jgi:hypothetical protein